ncbi:MAG: TfoX [bacterium]|nr:MAG: TfoX [bacterium]
MVTKNSQLSSLQNIGKNVEQKLNAIGIFNVEDLKRLGAAEAYKRMEVQTPDKTLPLCYYLYSLQGAIMETHWDTIPEAIKEKLKKEVTQ